MPADVPALPVRGDSYGPLKAYKGKLASIEEALAPQLGWGNKLDRVSCQHGTPHDHSVVVCIGEPKLSRREEIRDDEALVELFGVEPGQIFRVGAPQAFQSFRAPFRNYRNGGLSSMLTMGVCSEA